MASTGAKTRSPFFQLVLLDHPFARRIARVDEALFHEGKRAGALGAFVIVDVHRQDDDSSIFGATQDVVIGIVVSKAKRDGIDLVGDGSRTACQP